MILLIDNYDSFAFNLARYFAELGCAVEVVRNDRISVQEMRAVEPEAIVLSPGPCTPAEAGVSLDAVREFAESIPILGVCLGHQAIVAALGGLILRADRPVHGRASQIEHNGEGLFDGLPHPLTVGRYHSLVLEESALPNELAVVARTLDGVPMAVEHRRRPVFGVQFHPESVLTECGHRLLANFLDLAGVSRLGPATGCETVQPLCECDEPRDDRLRHAGTPLTW